MFAKIIASAYYLSILEGATNMTTIEILKKLKDEKYPLLLVSQQSGVDYMRMHRFVKKGNPLTEQEEAMIRAFAFIQPCFAKDAKK
jgi:histidinol phosphatase-like enzyme